MGVRIYAYAVDLSQLDAFLDTSLADLLCRYLRHGNNPTDRLRFTIADTDDTFVSTPSESIHATMSAPKGREHKVLTEAQVQTIPAVQCSARDHLANGAIYQTQWLLQAFSNCDGVDFIHRLIDGPRRWWIGSVLQCAQTTLAAADYEQLVHLFRKILRGNNCGYRLPEGDVGFSTEQLPFTPEDDPDLRFCRWSADDTFCAATLLSALLSQSPSFGPPPDPIGIAPDTSEWHTWVHGIVVSLLTIEGFDYDERNVFSFIG
jgi:hypothetical protein